MRRLGLTLFLISIVLLLATNAPAIPVARLQLQSDPGDYIGGGGTYDITYEDTDGVYFTINRYVDRNISLPPYYVGVSLSDVPPPYFSNWAFMHFETSRAGVALQPGYYPGALDQKDLYPGHPGMNVSFQHRGTSPVTGEFTIFQLTFSADYSKVLDFVIEFEQHDAGTPPALRGRLEYHAGGLTAIPEPNTALLTLLGLAGLSYRRRQA